MKIKTKLAIASLSIISGTFLAIQQVRADIAYPGYPVSPQYFPDYAPILLIIVCCCIALVVGVSITALVLMTKKSNKTEKPALKKK